MKKSPFCREAERTKKEPHEGRNNAPQKMNPIWDSNLHAALGTLRLSSTPRLIHEYYLIVEVITLYASPCDHSCDRSRIRQVRIVPVVGGVINRDLSATIAESRKMSLQIFVFIYRPELAELTRDFLLLHCCNGCH